MNDQSSNRAWESEPDEYDILFLKFVSYLTSIDPVWDMAPKYLMEIIIVDSSGQSREFNDNDQQRLEFSE